MKLSIAGEISAGLIGMYALHLYLKDSLECWAVIITVNMYHNTSNTHTHMHTPTHTHTHTHTHTRTHTHTHTATMPS